MNPYPVMVLCACPDAKTANDLAEALVQAKLVACAQVLPSMTSTYLWQGELCQENEVQLQLKSLNSGLTQIETLITQMHPYQVPEIISFKMESCNPAYLEWLRSNVTL
ncbi:divalent-cation tolerance protein CutA [Paraferrimonas sedimenticola]|uniref:Divalent-cation tolerance protein CutA n=1 Tax=Paraferrimonas sedimenticola TaxID=375674 RepID=A0AA37RVT9_9GAMM|nr:divalent-cation tolerance protein CutA [Paraferrimonas sedimenticola]GLP95759.1 divalent-cation tolerance protein CutA [Paraferrimonas sedimenticola]